MAEEEAQLDEAVAAQVAAAAAFVAAALAAVVTPVTQTTPAAPVSPAAPAASAATAAPAATAASAAPAAPAALVEEGAMVVVRTEEEEPLSDAQQVISYSEVANLYERFTSGALDTDEDELPF